MLHNSSKWRHFERHGFDIRVFKLCNEIEEMGKKLWLGVVLVTELWKVSCASQERIEANIAKGQPFFYYDVINFKWWEIQYNDSASSVS